MNPIHIKVEKTPSGKFGISAQHPASHYMEGDEQVPIPSRKTWIGHDGQDMQYGTGVEFENEQDAKRWLNCQINELKIRIAGGVGLDINSYLIIHHDAIIHWAGWVYDSEMITDKPKPYQKEQPNFAKEMENSFQPVTPVVESAKEAVKAIEEVKENIDMKIGEPTSIIRELLVRTDENPFPKVCLFIKSYKPDFVWLQYCLRSIEKFCTGYHEVLIVVPNKDLQDAFSLIPQHSTKFEYRVMGIDEPANGYLYQQVVKLNAHKYTDCELIQYHDSDCIFTMPTSPIDYMENGKPWQYCTPYEKVGDAIMWQGCVEKVLGFKDEFERMRRQNFLYYRSSLELLHERFPNLESHIMSQPGRHFSEFNLLGSFVAKYEPDKYIWKNTDEHPIIPERLKQFHSYSEYTAKNIEWMEQLLA